ncbi:MULTISPECIES: GntR family transcriptional regulator [Sulfitobacter]|uniref:GntR family transcriptional regulator n=1 Tax=Sulfitobacter TaxID=60136 RepID=UPI0023070160|nr:MULTISPECIES: GntR family transcriptional regulator [Sulfitobacter]MDF3383159.1 GntR family transcriptional regulator [Sulfitobacter sp. Ks11]MDF3386578.1 GntR family transcriptional regulator [Sulfitobacter sp. M85]MDF3389997.1 GntR family transcriptional regulator [Sulfitobacter sp. Ks16]MDF3400634.1 GntR family transcriptional regulator [Sulfitobacter sp. KE39]MDF3404055.1 GntR family transcriptional regulator [Sulfitobacter sp. Ks35]
MAKLAFVEKDFHHIPCGLMSFRRSIAVLICRLNRNDASCIKTGGKSASKDEGAMAEINQVSLGDAIYDRVCQDLVEGRLRPNEKVTIRGLAERLGTSSTPVRDAVQRLLRDEALVQRSVRDVRVPVLTEAQYLEIASIRRELEGFAAGRAAEMVGPKEIRRLKKIVERNEAAAVAGRWPQAVKYNQEFHFALVEAAEMPILLAILSGLWLRMGPLIAGYYAQEQMGLVRHHQAIIAACENRDPAAAAAEMRADIDDAKEGIIRYIQSFTTGE